jgi:hypothetical protein
MTIKSRLYSKGFTPILVLILLTFVGIGLYYFGTKNKQSLPPNGKTVPIASVQPSSSPTATADPTANWKTYKSEDLSFDYPSNWLIDKNTNVFKQGDEISVYTSVKLDAKVSEDRYLFTVASPARTDSGIRDWIDNEKILVPYPGEEAPKLSNDAVLGGEPAIQITNCSMGCYTFLYAKHGNIIYSVVYKSGSGVPENVQKTYSQILSTFKFTK